MIEHVKQLITAFFATPKNASAQVAKERLKVIVAHERHQNIRPDFLSDLQREITAVIAKYVNIDVTEVLVDFEEKNGKSILELNVTLPEISKIHPPKVSTTHKGKKKKGLT